MPNFAKLVNKIKADRKQDSEELERFYDDLDANIFTNLLEHYVCNPIEPRKMN